jgi:hypothetical protein
MRCVLAIFGLLCLLASAEAAPCDDALANHDSANVKYTDTCVGRLLKFTAGTCELLMETLIRMEESLLSTCSSTLSREAIARLTYKKKIISEDLATAESLRNDRANQPWRAPRPGMVGVPCTQNSAKPDCR